MANVAEHAYLTLSALVDETYANAAWKNLVEAESYRVLNDDHDWYMLAATYGLRAHTDGAVLSSRTWAIRREKRTDTPITYQYAMERMYA